LAKSTNACQVLEPAVVLQMLVVDIRHHRYRRKQLQERPVAFIGLGDHQLTAAEPRVAAERAQASADDRRRIEPGRSSTRAIIDVVVSSV
jgi:hypothetical protein